MLGRIWRRLARKRYRSQLALHNEFDDTNLFNDGCQFIATRWGQHSCCNSGSVIASTLIGNYCEIAWNVAISPRVHFFTNFTVKDFVYDPPEIFFSPGDGPFDGYFNRLGHDVWIGCNAIILSGVEVGNGAVISAGSVVTKCVPPYAIVGGNPARILRMRFPADVCAELEKLQWFLWDKEEIHRRRNELAGIVGFDVPGFKNRFWKIPKPSLHIPGEES